MSIFNNREGRIFVVVVTVLSALLFAVGVWAVNKINSKDSDALTKLAEDYQLLEKMYADEVKKIDDGVLLYQDPASLRNDLNQTLTAIRTNKDLIGNDKKKAMAQLNVLHEDKKRFESKISDFYNQKDQFTASEIDKIKQEIQKIKEQLASTLSDNKKLSAQLAAAIKKYKSLEKETSALREAKARLDKLIVEQAKLQTQLDTANKQKENLKDVLAKTSEVTEKQKEEIKKIKTITRIAMNFKATYERAKRQVQLDEEGKHKKGDINDGVFVSFELSPTFFDDVQDPGAKVVYLTLYKDNKPVVPYVKIPLKAEADQRVFKKLEFPRKQRLDSGKYMFRLEYQEKSIIDDYKFVIK